MEFGCWQIRITVVKQRQKQVILAPCCTLQGFRWDTSVSLAPGDEGMKHQPSGSCYPTFPPPTPRHIPQSQDVACDPAAGGSGHDSLQHQPLCHSSLTSPLLVTFSCAAGTGCNCASPAHFLPGIRAVGICGTKGPFTLSFCFF